MTPRDRKRVREKAQVSAAKRPREGRGTGGENPSWRVSLLDLAGPFGQRVERADATEILDFLSTIEKLTWDEILKNRRSGGHHHVEVRRICSAARKRLNQLDIETDTLISLRVTATKRIWGVRTCRGSPTPASTGPPTDPGVGYQSLAVHQQQRRCSRHRQLPGFDEHESIRFDSF